MFYAIQVLSFFIILIIDFNSTQFDAYNRFMRIRLSSRSLSRFPRAAMPRSPILYVWRARVCARARMCGWCGWYEYRVLCPMCGSRCVIGMLSAAGSRVAHCYSLGLAFARLLRPSRAPRLATRALARFRFKTILACPLCTPGHTLASLDSAWRGMVHVYTRAYRITYLSAGRASARRGIVAPRAIRLSRRRFFFHSYFIVNIDKSAWFPPFRRRVAQSGKQGKISNDWDADVIFYVII